MDVTGISSLAASISSNKSAQASTEAQVILSKKASNQNAQVIDTILQSATESAPVDRPGQGKLLAVA